MQVENPAKSPVCHLCGASAPPEIALCPGCGQRFTFEPEALVTRALTPRQEPKVAARFGTACFGEEMTLQIYVRGANQWIEKQITDECVLGRQLDPVLPGIDLAAYGGLELGVSRKHARLILAGSTLYVVDLGSINGTFLNGQRLLPFQPRVLRHDDRLLLGRLETRFLFMRLPRPV